MADCVKTKWRSWCTGPLSKGCSMCVQGKKLVLFVTGLCAQRCFYCPVNERKFSKDVVYANEWKVADPENPKELLEEARLTEACGAGFTGGDPLAKLERTCAYIRLLKKEFGKDFHIHLYTPFKLVTPESLKALYDAGLDEIRFHPNLDDDSLWPRLQLALKYDWDIGVEIPALPGYEEKTKRMIDFIAGKVKFLNLNELELSDTQASHYKLGELYKPKDNVSYGARGSAEMALEMLAYAKSKGLRGHFCTASLKDGVQMRQRLIRRARHASLAFDVQTDEGTLLRGCAYLPELAPGMSYRKRLKEADKGAALARLEGLIKAVRALGVGDTVVDSTKLRLLMPALFVRRNAAQLKNLGLMPAVVEEYPTADALEVDVEFL